MFTYKTLENTSIEKLHQTFVSAFSDYQVKIDLPFWKFQQMLQRRGFVSDLSIGAFKNEKLVGFVLNGFRNWNDKPTVYDLGTGVIGEYRKKGITSTMLSHFRELIKGKKVEQYLLEVLQPNTSAISLYKKQGFKIVRNFECFQLDKNNYSLKPIYEVKHIDKIDSDNWKQLLKFWDFKPSWQNSIDSINSASDTFVYSIIHLDDKVVGYGIIEKKTGDIPQIAVDKNYRRKKIASNIIADLIKNTESNTISVLNVEENSNSMKDFLLDLGFDYTISQHEMILKI